MKKSLRLISLLLCLLLVLPMLFACKEESEDHEEDDVAQQEDAGIDLTIPDFKFCADVTVTEKQNNPYGNSIFNPNTTESYTTAALISLSGDNLRIEIGNGDLTTSIIFCDNILYATAYDQKYKLDFNNINIKTLMPIVMSVIAAYVPEFEGDYEDIDLYTAAGKNNDLGSVISSAGSALFADIQTQINENGIEMTVYTGIQQKVAAIVDRLLRTVIYRYFGTEADFEIDYDNIKIGVGGTDKDAAFTLNFGGEYSEELIPGVADIVSETEFNVSVNVVGSVGEIAPITAPADVAEYEDVLPLLVRELIGSIN